VLQFSDNVSKVRQEKGVCSSEQGTRNLNYGTKKYQFRRNYLGIGPQEMIFSLQKKLHFTYEIHCDEVYDLPMHYFHRPL
jgi:hypothetical protein